MKKKLKSSYNIQADLHSVPIPPLPFISSLSSSSSSFSSPSSSFFNYFRRFGRPPGPSSSPDGTRRTGTGMSAYRPGLLLPQGFKIMAGGQTFCDLHTLLHSYYGFPGACYKVTIFIFHVEGLTFVGLIDCTISHFETR